MAVEELNGEGQDQAKETLRVGYDKFPGGRAGVSVGCILYRPETRETFHITELLDDYALAEPGSGLQNEKNAPTREGEGA